MKLIILIVANWWVFGVLMLLALSAKTGWHKIAFDYISGYSGQYWWVFGIFLAIALVFKFLFSLGNVQ